MRGFLKILLALLIVCLFCPGASLAETVTLRLDLTHFDQSLLTSPLTGDDYVDIDVDPSITIVYFQEYYLKQRFPELTNYGSSQENALAYTNKEGELYDGIYNILGDIEEVQDGKLVLYLWLSSGYISWIGAQTEEDVFVLDILEAGANDFILPEDEERLLVGGVSTTMTALQQVFLNGRSVSMRLSDGEAFVPFSMSLKNTSPGLRISLIPTDPADEIDLVYDETALSYLETLGVTEICVVLKDGDERYTLAELYDKL